MSGNKKFIISWAVGAAFLLLFFYAATESLWTAARTSAARGLENQVNAVLAEDLAEGNLFKLGSSLSRLKYAGALYYAEIRAYSSAGGWERIFRTDSVLGDTTDKKFSGYTCKKRLMVVMSSSDALSLLTTIPSHVEGAECVGLLVDSDMPVELKHFRRKLTRSFGLMLGAILVFFMWLTMAWHKKALSLEVAAKTAQAEKDAEIGRMAAQVAHDIRSPLVALDAALKHSESMPEEQRVMLRHAVNRIRDIANNLLYKDRAAAGEGGGMPAAGVETAMLSGLIEPVIAEKRLQYGQRAAVLEYEPGPGTYGLFAALNPVEFRRVISNLLNNAVEALDSGGKVTLALERAGGKAEVRISDTGKGIPAELLGRLGEKGFTSGKAGGSGLGFYHAKTAIAGWGGSLAVDSVLGKGTTVTIRLPAAPAPAWFAPVLEVEQDSLVAVLDDDETVHRVWKGRFESARAGERGVQLVGLSSSKIFRDWLRDNPSKAAKATFLLDYELLGSGETGLSLAKEFGLASRALLVTSRYEEKFVAEECARLGMRMIPKGLAGAVPITIANTRPGTGGQAVLIDDDPLVRMNWKTAARAKGVALEAYSTAEEFHAAGELPSDTEIYIDSELGDGVKGEELAASLKEKGFTKLFLQTGHPPERFGGFPWLKVIGKEPPWV